MGYRLFGNPTTFSTILIICWVGDKAANPTVLLKQDIAERTGLNSEEILTTALDGPTREKLDNVISLVNREDPKLLASPA